MNGILLHIPSPLKGLQKWFCLVGAHVSRAYEGCNKILHLQAAIAGSMQYATAGRSSSKLDLPCSQNLISLVIWANNDIKLIQLLL
jgi:hypothetical protein